MYRNRTHFHCIRRFLPNQTISPLLLLMCVITLSIPAQLSAISEHPTRFAAVEAWLTYETATITVHWRSAASTQWVAIMGRKATETFWTPIDTVRLDSSYVLDRSSDWDEIQVMRRSMPEGRKLPLFSRAYLPLSTVALQRPWQRRCLLIADWETGLHLKNKLLRWCTDLREEGWQADVIVLDNITPALDVIDVKELITAEYQRKDKDSLTHVFLVGRVPIPYSGGFSQNGAFSPPDGHEEHGGAWPTDAFYADVEVSPGRRADNSWTDLTVHIADNQTAPNDRNKNIPNDGKWDQTLIPTDLDICVGRLDARQLPALGTIEDNRVHELELLSLYFDRNHEYRRGRLPASGGLVDDNFGMFSRELKEATLDEAFAATAWRSFPVVNGPDHTVSGDWMCEDEHSPCLERDTFLLAYGCGGGGFTHCSYVVSTADLSTRPLNAVFSFLFGSYFADFDSEDNLLRATILAPNSLALVAGWMGRPHWFLHPLATGSTIGECQRLSVNNDGLYIGASIVQNGSNTAIVARNFLRGIHTSLMGDPTLRIVGTTELIVTAFPKDKTVVVDLKPGRNMTHANVAVLVSDDLETGYQPVIPPVTLTNGRATISLSNVDGKYALLLPYGQNEYRFGESAFYTAGRIIDLRTMLPVSVERSIIEWHHREDTHLNVYSVTGTHVGIILGNLNNLPNINVGMLTDGVYYAIAGTSFRHFIVISGTIVGLRDDHSTEQDSY